MFFACESVRRFVVRLILYVQLVFGILFVIRTHQLFRARALLPVKTVTKTGTAFVSACLLIGFFGIENVFLASVLLILNIFCSLIALYLLEMREIARLQSEFPLFLDRWILNLRLGSSLTSAREAALRDQSLGFQTLLRPVFSAQNARDSHAILPVNVMRELEKLAREAHSALARLENLRQLLRKSAEFRRKSGQATRQTAIQSGVLLVLLLALMTFTLHRFGWRKSGDLIILSGGLALMGVVSMYALSRKSRWKI